MITLADNFRLGVRPEDIISALRGFTKKAKRRQRMASARDIRYRATFRQMLPALRRARYNKHPRTTACILAANLGVSESAVLSWEMEIHIPPPDVFERWRALLGC